MSGTNRFHNHTSKKSQLTRAHAKKTQRRKSWLTRVHCIDQSQTYQTLPRSALIRDKGCRIFPVRVLAQRALRENFPTTASSVLVDRIGRLRGRVKSKPLHLHRDAEGPGEKERHSHRRTREQAT